jgi:hypothetical protein
MKNFFRVFGSLMDYISILVMKFPGSIFGLQTKVPIVVPVPPEDSWINAPIIKYNFTFSLHPATIYLLTYLPTYLNTYLINYSKN